MQGGRLSNLGAGIGRMGNTMASRTESPLVLLAGGLIGMASYLYTIERVDDLIYVELNDREIVADDLALSDGIRVLGSGFV
ncbi:hypothetical protein GGI35DRAFT_459673 [Trichoderma velutinum]